MERCKWNIVTLFIIFVLKFSFSITGKHFSTTNGTGDKIAEVYIEKNELRNIDIENIELYWLNMLLSL